MKSSFVILSLIIISFISIIHCEEDGPSNSNSTSLITVPSSNSSSIVTAPNTPDDAQQNNQTPNTENKEPDPQSQGITESAGSTSQPTTNQSSSSQEEQGSSLDIETDLTDTPIPTPVVPEISESQAEEMTGGGVWSSIGLAAVVICGLICLERLYSSCKKVYQKRTGRYGFSRLHNQTFNEFEDEDDDEEDENLGVVTTQNRNTKHSDQDSV